MDGGLQEYACLGTSRENPSSFMDGGLQVYACLGRLGIRQAASWMVGYKYLHTLDVKLSFLRTASTVLICCLWGDGSPCSRASMWCDPHHRELHGWWAASICMPGMDRENPGSFMNGGLQVSAYLGRLGHKACHC